VVRIGFLKRKRGTKKVLISAVALRRGGKMWAHEKVVDESPWGSSGGKSEE